MNDIFLLSCICFLAMVSPGPDFIMVSRNALKYEAPQAYSTALGIITSCCCHSVFCIMGLAVIVAKSILLFSLIKYAGALYLIYLGIKGLLAKSVATDFQTVRGARKEVSLRFAFFEGFLCNFLNPKLAVFLLSLFTQFISIDATMQQKSVVAGVFVIESAIYWPLVVLFLQGERVRNTFSRIQTSLDKIFGALLIAMGIKVAVSRD